MSGTNQSKLIKKQEKTDLEHTNNINTCISTNKEEVTAENSNAENNKLQDDMEGNLQLQIQEAIAATIRASRKSAALEQQPMNNYDSSVSSTAAENAAGIESSSCEDQNKFQNEVLEDAETHENCESNSPNASHGVNVENLKEVEDAQTNLNEARNRKILNNLIQDEDLSDDSKEADCTDSSNSADKVQNKQEIQDENQTQKPNESSSSEISNSEDMMVDSEQENKLNECSANSHSKDDDMKNLNNEEGSQKIPKENLQNLEVVNASDSNESLSPIEENDSNSCFHNTQSEDNVINAESLRDVTIAEHLQTEKAVKCSLSCHNDDDLDRENTTNSAEGQCAVEDTPQIENSDKIEDIESCRSEDDLDSENTKNSAEGQRAVEDTRQIENNDKIEDVESCRNEDDLDSENTTNSAEGQCAVEDTPQIENNDKIEDVESCRNEDDLDSENTTNSAEGQCAVEDTPQIENKIEDAESCHNEDNVDSENTTNSGEGQHVVQDTPQIENNDKIEDVESCCNEDDLDSENTTNSAEGQCAVEDTPQVENNDKIEDVESCRNEDDLDNENTTNSAEGQCAVEDTPQIENSDKIEDVESCRNEDDLDSKNTTNSAERQCAVEDTQQIENNDEIEDVESCRNEDNVDRENTANSGEGQHVVQDTPQIENNDKIEDVESCCNEGDLDSKNTTNSAESQRAVEDTPEIENNDKIEDIESKEPTADLQGNTDPTTCSNDDMDTDNLKEVQHAIEETQKDSDVSDSKTCTTENLAVENELQSTSNNCTVDDINMSNIENTVEGQCLSEQTLKAQEPVKITSNDKDFPADVKQASQLNDSVLNENVRNTNKVEENPRSQKDVESPKRIFIKEIKEADATESEQQENLSHTISTMQEEDVFPVIEIVEEDSGIQDVVEVIDVDDSNVIKMKPGRLIQEKKSIFKNRYASGVCIEILSDEDEDEVQEIKEIEEVKVEENSKIQQSVKVDIVETPKNQLEDILQQVKLLTSSEYLLFYLKLPPKWNLEKTSANLCDRLGTKLENNEIVIPDKNKRILRAIDASIRETSKNTVQNIIKRVEDLTRKEYLWLRSNLPTDCINPNLQHCLLPHSSNTSQTILWLKTHLEERSESMLLKQEVFNRYQDFCKHTNMQLMSASRFGKLINQVFPKIGRKRLRVKGHSAYYYVGLHPRTKLDPPRLPKVSEKLQQKRLTDENESIKCENESDVCRNNQPVQTISPSESKNSCRTNQIFIENESDDSYRSDQLDGQTILVHDPLELLNMPTNDNKLLNDASFHQSYYKISNNIFRPASLDKNLKTAKSSSCLSNYAGTKHLSPRSRNLTSVINNSVRKVKYKEYRHPSVQKVFKEFNTIVLPPEVFKLNINPSVSMDNSEMNNWYAEHIKNFAQKFSNVVIKKVGRSQNFDVTFKCCNDTFEVSGSYAKQLTNLTENLSNIVVRKSENSSNYKVARISFKNVPLEEPCTASKPFHIAKQLTNRKRKAESECVKSYISTEPNANIHDEMTHIKHLSVQRLYKKFKNIDLPEEIYKSDIDPVIVLNSGEVIEWYIKKLDCLKHEISNVKNSKSDPQLLRASSPRCSTSSSSRHSKAKMMNFCEIDSSDYDSDNRNVQEYDSIPFETKYIDILQSGIENATVSVSCDSDKINVSEMSHEIASEVVNEPPAYAYNTNQNENVQQESCIRQKRLSVDDEEEINEIEQKRKRFYCSKITISPNQKASISEPPLISNMEQIPYFKETSVEKCSSSTSHEVESFVCPFCALVFDQRKQFITHKKTHVYCVSCKRKLKNLEAMRQHLFNHCSLNNIQNKPSLKLQRIDSVPSIVKKYARAFRDAIENSDVSIVNHEEIKNYITNKASSKSRDVLHGRPNVILSTAASNVRSESMEMDNAKLNLSRFSKRTYSKLPRGTTVRILKSAKANSQIQTPIGSVASTAVSSENQQDHVYQQAPQEPMFQLKNTISSNLNKILLLSNNVSQSQIQSSNIVYGTLYVNNTSGQSSPNVCLNSSLYNPTGSGIDCAMNTNPSCSNPDLQQPPTFMQIVESPNTSVMQYAAPISQNNTLVTFEHQDHSYHQQQQQQLFQVGNNLTNMNNIVFVSNNVPQITELQPATGNASTSFTPFFDQSVKTNETETTNYVLNNTETTNVDNPPPQGQFRIRVKNIQELR